MLVVADAERPELSAGVVDRGGVMSGFGDADSAVTESLPPK